MLTLIAAMDEDRGIGRAGRIPWISVDDFIHFKNETVGGAVIMGSRTWESIDKNPLPNRMNIIVGMSHITTPPDKDVCFLSSVWGAIELAKQARSRIYGIGGQQIYEAMLPVADRLVLTKIRGSHVCDTFFPTFNESDWNVIDISYSGLTITEYLRK